MSEDKNQKVLVMAPQSTIAKALMRRMNESGIQVACLGRTISNIDENTCQWKAACDLTDFDAVDDAVNAAVEALGGLTGIVNCSGTMLLKPAHLTSRDEYEQSWHGNVTTSFAAVRAAGRVMSGSGGSVVLISSAAATLGMANHEAIAAAKAAIEGLVRSAAATYASRGLRFNAVAPGLVDTNLTTRLVSNIATLKVSERLHPLGRVGVPDDIARAILWFLNPDQSWVTGQVIGVDGGLSHVQPRMKM